MPAAQTIKAMCAVGGLLSLSAYGQVQFTTIYTVAGQSPVSLAAAHGALYVTTDDYGVGPGEVLALEPPSAAGGAWNAKLLYGFGAPNGSEPSVGRL